MSESVMVTEASRDLIVWLKACYGSLVFMQSGAAVMAALRYACWRAICYLAIATYCLEQSRGCSFYIDREQYERWRRPAFLIDVSPGDGDTFSLEGPEGMHFVARAGEK